MIVRSVDFYLASGVNASLLHLGFANVSQSALFLSGGSLGLFLGALYAGEMGDRFGRTNAYQWNLLFFAVMTAACAFAPNITWMIVFRCLSSIGMGAELVIGFAMVNEMAPVKSRGKWAVGMTVITTWGSPLGMYLCSLVVPAYGWRVLFAGVGVVAVLVWFLRAFMPESPRWLFTQGRYAEAERMVRVFEADDPDHDAHLAAAKAELAAKAKKAPQKDLQLTGTQLFWRFVLASLMLTVTDVLQYTFTQWVPTLLTKSGVSFESSLLMSTVMLIAAPLGALVGMVTVEKWGRKFNLVVGFVATTICGLVYATQTSNLGHMVAGFVLTFFIYVLISTMFGAFVPEMFPTKFRMRGTGVANACAKLGTVLSPFAVAALLSSLGTNSVFFAMSLLAAVAVLVTVFFVPETRNKHID